MRLKKSYIGRHTWVNRTVPPVMGLIVAASVWYVLQNRPSVPVGSTGAHPASPAIHASATPTSQTAVDTTPIAPISPVVHKERDHLKFTVEAPSIKKVQKVEFYVEQQFVGAAYSQPYAVVVREADLAVGAHTVVAKIYTDTGTTQSKPAAFTATATQPSQVINDSLAVPQPPAPTTSAVPVPQNLSVAATSDGMSATLSWDGVAAATSYQIWRDGSQVATSTGAGYTDTGLTPGHTYDYAVIAVIGNKLSAQSTAIAVTMPDPHVLGDSTTDPGLANPPAQSSVQSPPPPVPTN